MELIKFKYLYFIFSSQVYFCVYFPKTLVCSFLVVFAWLGYRVMLASQNELGSVVPSSVLESTCEELVFSSLNFWQNYQ